MIKQMIALVVASILIIVGMTYSQQVMQYIINAHDWIAQILTEVFSGGQAGNLARGLIALLAIPVVVGLIPALVYWAIKRNWFPYFMQLVWVTWLLQVGALLILSKTAG